MGAGKLAPPYEVLMGIVTVYDTAGESHEKESIDASECVKECGWSLTAKAEEVPAEVAQPSKRHRG